MVCVSVHQQHKAQVQKARPEAPHNTNPKNASITGPFSIEADHNIR
jgi:hypothetical protein